MTLQTYLQNIEFDYLKIYSGFRGVSFMKYKKSLNEQIRQLITQLETARYMQRPKIGLKIEALKQNLHNPKVIDKNGNVHTTVYKTTMIQVDDKLYAPLMTLLTQENNEGVTSCLPVFRDAIVFYSTANKIKGILHICFECAAIHDENNERLSVDFRTFEELSLFFDQIGHMIE